MVKINVLIVTYNQCDTISRAIESVLRQKDWGLNEIIISDDCSDDNNWEVIQEYVAKYPDTIKAYQNSPNLGIYGNVQKLHSLRGDADLYIELAGDDALCDEYFKQLQNFIAERNIDLNSKFSIYSDWDLIRPNGKIFHFKNNKVQNADPFRLRYRFLIYIRSVAISAAAFSCFKDIPINRGISYAENIYEYQYQKYSDVSYYCPCVGSVYYSQIGMSTKMHTREQTISEGNMWRDFLINFQLNKKDRLYTEERIARCDFDLHPNIKTWLKMLFLHFKSFDRLLGLNLIQEGVYIKDSIKRLYRVIFE